MNFGIKYHMLNLKAYSSYLAVHYSLSAPMWPRLLKLKLQSLLTTSLNYKSKSEARCEMQKKFLLRRTSKGWASLWTLLSLEACFEH